jgi:hypothetical protein
LGRGPLILGGLAAWDIYKNIPRSEPTILVSSDKQFSATFPKNYGQLKTTTTREEIPTGTIIQCNYQTTNLNGMSFLKITRYEFPQKTIDAKPNKQLISNICQNYCKSLFDSDVTVYDFEYKGLPSCSSQFTLHDKAKSGESVAIDGKAYVILKDPYVFVIAGLFQQSPNAKTNDMQELLNSLKFN